MAHPAFRKPGRPKKPAPAPAVDLGPLTDGQELALAILLWKSLRCHGSFAGAKGSQWMPTDASCDLGERAIAMAKAAGVKDEYLALMFRLDLVRVTLTPME